MSSEIAKPSATKDIRDYLDRSDVQSQIARVLPQHMTPDRFARVAITAITKTPKLMDCGRETLLRCLMDCSSLGLEPDGRHAHLIPYGKDCTLIIDYKGLIALARRSGSVVLFKGELVRENDVFSWEDNVVRHSIDFMTDRGKLIAAYSYVKFKDGSEDWEVMTVAEVDAIRKRSRAGNGGPWVSDYDEMAKKTAIRRHSKRLTLSPEFQAAAELDDDRVPERNVTPKPSVRREPLNLGAPTRQEALPPDAEEWNDAQDEGRAE
jgi:recombination protein RecT